MVQSKLRNVAARPRLRQLFGRRPPADAPGAPRGVAPTPSDSNGERPLDRVPQPGRLRRERRALMRRREEGIRDVGGLALEMYRRDSFRESLLYEQCAEIASMEERLRELDVLLEGRRAPADRCACGAPLLVGARFCANCGRPARRQTADACVACGHALAADARFCPACGTAVGDADAAAAAAADA